MRKHRRGEAQGVCVCVGGVIGKLGGGWWSESWGGQWSESVLYHHIWSRSWAAGISIQKHHWRPLSPPPELSLCLEWSDEVTLNSTVHHFSPSNSQSDFLRGLELKISWIWTARAFVKKEAREGHRTHASCERSHRRRRRDALSYKKGLSFFFTLTGCHLMMGGRGEQAGECKSEGPLGGYEVGSKVLWEA